MFATVLLGLLLYLDQRHCRHHPPRTPSLKLRPSGRREQGAKGSCHQATALQLLPHICQTGVFSHLLAAVLNKKCAEHGKGAHATSVLQPTSAVS